VTLEPDNWRHHFRLSFVSWGEERLRAADRALALLPDFPLAHWLAATVHVARQVLVEAEREIEAGLASQAGASVGTSRFSAVALQWMRGLIHLAAGDHDRALDAFERELSFENEHHLYARECAANTWYAIGALRLRQGRREEAKAAFERALERVATHSLALVGLAATGSRHPIEPQPPAPPFNLILCLAAQRALAGDHAAAASIVEDALASAPPGNAGWLLPIEPLLDVGARPDCWARALARLRNRAA